MIIDLYTDMLDLYTETLIDVILMNAVRREAARRNQYTVCRGCF